MFMGILENFIFSGEGGLSITECQNSNQSVERRLGVKKDGLEGLYKHG